MEKQPDRGYDADLYDAITPTSFLGDVEWYRRKAQQYGGPVLELGAGTGRVSIAVARDGVQVYALDSHPGMLAVLRRKIEKEPAAIREHVVPIEADMRAFRLEERFALVIAPFRALLHNLTEADHLATFNRVRAHLRPGGRFAFNVFHPSLEFMAQHAGALAGVWRWVGTYPREDGTFIVRSDANRYETVPRRVHSLLRFEEFGADGSLNRTFVHQRELSYLYASDIRRLLEQAGFGSIAIAGGFDERPLHRDTDEMVVEARVD